MNKKEDEALSRLLKIAYRDTGQSRRVANFLLSWWNAGTCGAWDPTDLWALDQEIEDDILVLVGAISRWRSYPDTLGYKSEFDRLVREWRPHLLSEGHP